jgi:hypothetical protein
MRLLPQRSHRALRAVCVYSAAAASPRHHTIPALEQPVSDVAHLLPSARSHRALRYTISISGDAAVPWELLLDAWRRLAAATFPARADPQPAALSSPPPPAPPAFTEFTQWAASKGLCRYLISSALCASPTLLRGPPRAVACALRRLRDAGTVASLTGTFRPEMCSLPCPLPSSSAAMLLWKAGVINCSGSELPRASNKRCDATCCSLAPLLDAIEGLDAGGRALLFALCENAQVRRAAQPHIPLDMSCNCSLRLLCCRAGGKRVAPVFRFLAPRLPNPVAVERCGAASAPGITRAMLPTDILLIYFQGTPLHERVAFECGSLRQFYEQVRCGGCARMRPLVTRARCSSSLR